MPIINGTIIADTLIGTNSRDQIYGLEGADRIEGGNGADQLYGGAGDDHLLGGAGNDALYGGEGVNTLEGGAGNDRYFSENNTYTIIETADGGIDTAYFYTDVDRSGWFATQPFVENYYFAYDDSPNGEMQEHAIFDMGVGRSDGGDHRIFGGAQNDTYIWNAGHDVFYGGDGDDIASATHDLWSSNDHLSHLTYYGENGDDVLAVEAFQIGDYLFDEGDQNVEYLYYDGGDGDDYAYISGRLYFDYNTEINIELKDVESVYLLIYVDNYLFRQGIFFEHTIVIESPLLTETTPYDLYGIDYSIDSLGYNLQLSGNDEYISIDFAYKKWPLQIQHWINTGAGNDRIDLGYFHHRDDFSNQRDHAPISVFTSTGNDMIVSYFDNLTADGGAGDDYFEMSGSNLTLRGGGGDDEINVVVGGDNWISGGQGDDVIRVEGWGNNKIYGGAGDDVIIGGEEDDLIYGGAGADFLDGGYGADRYVFLKPDAGAIDKIKNFAGVELEGGDIIDLSALAPGRLIWRGDLAFTGTANEVRMIAGQVQVDFNADGVPDLRIDVGYDLMVGDFIL